MKVLACAAASGLLLAQSTLPGGPKDYIGAIKDQDVLRFVQPPPEKGDPLDAIDRAVFQATRSLEGSPRWLLAQSDDNLSPSAILSAFSCSLGSSLTPENAPNLTELLIRVTRDTNAIVSQAKNHYRRQRPFLIDQGPTCVPATGFLAKSFDYPSGHASTGWLTGLVLAELWPDRAREFGESRVFCGVQNVSAVEAARTMASAIVAMLHGSSTFRQDPEAVRPEVARLRSKNKRKTNPETCAAQSETLSLSPYSQPR